MEDLSQRQPSPQALTLPHSVSSAPPDHSAFGHVEDESSESSWCTPFEVKVNFEGVAVDGTLDATQHCHGPLSFTTPIFGQNVVRPPTNTSCSPSGTVWLNVGFMGKLFYQQFAVIQDLVCPRHGLYEACLSHHPRTYQNGAHGCRLTLPQWACWGRYGWTLR